jgi:hypothetical protein
MWPLLFIVILTGLGVFISTQVVSEVSWFTYYVGGMIGLLLSSLILEVINRMRRKKEQGQKK